MTNHAEITNLLKQFSGQARILTIPRAYIDMLDGDHLAALFLSQAVFLSDRAADDDGWFAKSYTDWHAELGLSERQVRRVVDLLRAVGIETKLRRSGAHDMAATLHYRVDMDVLTEAVTRFCRTRSDETSERRSDETSERSYIGDKREREDALSPSTEELPAFMTPYQRSIAVVPKAQPDGGARAYSLVEAWCDAWDIIVPRYRTGAHKTQTAGANLLADMGATPEDIAAMCAERRAKGRQPDECPLRFLANDYVGWKQRAAPAAPSGPWGRELT
jgi:hypothetical protein